MLNTNCFVYICLTFRNYFNNFQTQPGFTGQLHRNPIHKVAMGIVSNCLNINYLMKRFSKPTDSELAILQILWEYGPSSVRFVNDKLNEQNMGSKEIGYTTTLKLMQIMLQDKKLVTRNTDSRTHIYKAAVSESETQGHLLEEFVDSTFRGSAMKLVMQALGNHQASTEELDQIKALIKKIEKDQS